MSQLEKRRRQNQIDQSRSWMFEAFISLLKEIQYKDISIAQIVKKAGVSRQTFYRHFQNKEDLIQWQMAKLFTMYIEKLNSFEKYNLRDDLTLYFDLTKKEAPILKILFDAGLENLIMKNTIDYVYHLEAVYEHKSERELQYVAEYFTGGIFMILLRWIRDGMIEAPEELADLIINRCMSTEIYEQERKPLMI